MRHPFLVGEHLYVRKLEKEDLSGDYFDALNNYELTQWFNAAGRFPNSLAAMESYLESADADPNQILFAVCEKESDRHIGNIHVTIDWVNSYATTGRIIWAKDTQGKGYGVESFKLVINYLFKRLNLNRVCSGMIEGNDPALKNWEKLGYKIEGRLRKMVWQNGEYKDVIEGGVLREDWKF